MLLKTLAAGAALSMLAASGTALAQTKPAPQIGPKAPIPYSQLKAYSRASPKVQTSKDWSAPANAAADSAVDTSASTPASSMSGDAKASTSMDTMTPPTPSTAPPMSPTAPSMPMTPPTLPDPMLPMPGSNLPGSPPVPPPLTPK